MGTDDKDDKDKPTIPPPPPIPSFASTYHIGGPLPKNSKKLLRSVTPKKISEAQERITSGLRDALKNLLDKFFDETRDVINGALLHAGLDFYQDGLTRGKATTSLIFRAFVEIADRKSRVATLNPIPSVTLVELLAELKNSGFDVLLPELQKQCVDLQVPISSGDEDNQ